MKKSSSVLASQAENNKTISKAQLKINSYKINTFLASLTDAEFGLVEMNMSMARDAKALVKKLNLDKKTFCELMKINPRRYNDYLKGSFNYSIKEMSLFQCAWMKLETELSTKNIQKDVDDKTTSIVKPKKTALL